VLVQDPPLAHNLLTPTEVLAYLRVNVRTVYRLMRTGELPAVRVGRQWRIRRADLEHWLRRQVPESPWDHRPADARPADDGSQPLRVPSWEHEDSSYGERT
jgi:excisionase family DNA binding protein